MSGKVMMHFKIQQILKIHINWDSDSGSESGIDSDCDSGGGSNLSQCQ